MVVNHAIDAQTRQCLGRPKDAVKREGIVRAAASLFLERGYESTSMEAVSKLADVSKLTIYSHFANKAELFKAVIQESCDRQAAPDNFMRFAQLPPAQGLLQLGCQLAEFIFSSDAICLLRIMQAEAVNHPQVIRIFYETGPQRVKAKFGELLQAWVDQGLLQIADIALATEQFFSLLKGEAHVKAMLMLAAEPQAEDLAAHVQNAVQLFLAGYLSKTAIGGS